MGLLGYSGMICTRLILCHHSALYVCVLLMATSNTPPWSSTATTTGSIFFSCFLLSMSFLPTASGYALPNCQTIRLDHNSYFKANSSTVVTLTSIPFLYDYFSNGGNMKYIRSIPNLSVMVCRSFQSYMA